MCVVTSKSMRIVATFLLFLNSVSIGFGQEDFSNPYVDSLKIQLPKTADNARVDLLNKLAYNFYYFDNDSSKKYATEAIELAVKLDYKKGLSESQRMMGIASKAKNEERVAIEWLYKGLKTAQSINYDQGIADNLNSIGIFYKSVQDTRQAISYFLQSIEYQIKAKNKLREGILYTNIANIYLDENLIDSSYFYFQKSKAILDSINDERWLAMVYSQIAKLYLKSDDVAKAEDYSKKAIDISIRTGQTFHLRQAYLNMAEVQILRKKYEESLQLADKALAYSIKIGFFPFLIDAYHIQYRLYSKLEKYEEALFYHEKYAAYQDSVTQRKTQIEANLVKFLAELQRKEEENLVLKKANKDQEAQNEANKLLIYRQTMIAIGFGITLLIVSILAVVGFRLRKKESETNKKLQTSNLELEEQKEELSATLQMVQDLNAQMQAQTNTLNNIAIVSLSDMEGNVISVNDNFCNVTGYSRESLLGQKHNIFERCEEGLEESQSFWETISAGNTWRGEIKNKKKDGEFFWADTAIAPVLNEEGKPKQFFYLQFEVTERKNYLNELSHKSEELEALNQLKDKLLSIVSHDFRSPLNSLRGTLSLFLKGVISNDEISMLTESLLEKLDNTYNLLENLLNWAKSQMQGTKVYIKEVNLKSIIDDCLELLDPIAEKKLIKLSNNVDTTAIAMADNEMVKLVLRNLISNAIKFSTAGGKIEINVASNGSKIISSVKDNGTGISNENQDRLFKPDSFSTVGTSNEAGMGLGLLLCKDFVEKNSGEIWFESEFEKGSTFYFSLPKKQ